MSFNRKCYFCTMNERINWIDWAKALAVCTVVFCHLPQSQEWLYYRYLQSVIIVVFFFLSGYLKKDRGSTKANWQKYWHSLILPYILYNVIVYPYWLLKYYMLHREMPDLFSALKPIFGAILFQHENSFCEPLNGPLWYLPAILIMHVTIDLCRKTKYQQTIMITLCIMSFLLYAANKYYYFAPNLTPMGIMRNLPYYYMGYVFGQYHLFKETNLKRDIIGSITCLTASIILFSWHLDAFHKGSHMQHIVLFYPFNICFLFGTLYLSKTLNTIKSDIITNLSIGTLAIIGLHMAVISIINYALEYMLHLTDAICYQWPHALMATIAIISTLYPLIIIGKAFFPIIIGKKL